jgi:hypothetical protein
MAATVQARASDQYVELGFPLAGIDLSQPFTKQAPRQMTNGIWGRTTPAGQNVRGFDFGSQRLRGGCRPGLSKYLPVTPIDGWLLQELAVIVGSGYKPPGAPVQLAPSGRVVTLVVVSQGRVFYANAGDQTWTEATNNTGLTPPLIFSGVVYSAPNNQRLWFADGTNWCYFDPSNGSVNTWTVSAGQLPVDNLNNTPRLIALWRGRIVLSGLINDPQNWFMSKVNDPSNFDYSPLSTTPQDAIAGNNAPMGLIGDVVTSIVPYNDDVLIWGGDHTIYQMSGDPQAGGQLDLVSDAIGFAYGIPWCKDPYGNLYFVSNKTGIYSFVPGQQPQRISQPIEQLLVNIDTGANQFRLLWNDRYQGFHVFVGPLAAPAVSTHFFYEQRTGAWWTDQFGNTNLDPLACCTFDGNTPGDRHPLIGSWDGYVRNINPTAIDDDGTPISSSVTLGPILTGDLDEMLLKDLQAVLGTTSGQVTFNVFVGATPELALATTPVAFGTWKAARNFTNQVRRSGHAVYVNISATNLWAMESIRARIAAQGKVRRRGA